MNPTLDTLDLVKSALGAPDDRIAKTINTGSGLVAYDLQAPAKNLSRVPRGLSINDNARGPSPPIGSL